MKIKTFRCWEPDQHDEIMNKNLENIINKGFMIIDYGFNMGGRENSHQYGFIKYCDKQFLRDYKIKSIMNEI